MLRSSQREKVSFDPLSAFLPSMDDQVSVAIDETSKVECDTLPSTIFHINDNIDQCFGEKSLAPSNSDNNLVINENVAPIVEINIRENESGLGFGVDLWSQTTVSEKKTEDVLDINEKSEISGLFGSNNVVMTKKEGNSSNSKKSEEDVSDLRVGKIMEREELDFSTFGTSSVRYGGYDISDNNNKISKLSGADFDLSELDNIIALGSKSSSKQTSVEINSSISSPFSTKSEPEFDLANLDINSYISGVQNRSGGGLFD